MIGVDFFSLLSTLCGRLMMKIKRNEIFFTLLCFLLSSFFSSVVLKCYMVEMQVIVQHK